MTTFNEYWKEKAQKRRKSWAAKARRFAEQHTQLEDIRKEVYLPLDYGINFDFEDYKLFHFIKSNPLVCWQNMNFRFSEEGLRAALEAEGADMNSFRMSVSQQPIKGLEVPQLENVMKPNKVYDYDKKICSWLQRMYEICTDVETVRLSYRQITMIIKRYSTEGMPFGYYELNPCEQLTKSAMLMQETDFYILNVATLLMEAAAEWELRQEELNYYAKKLKIRTMEAATTDSIEFELWDDKKLQKKVLEYIKKDYTLYRIIDQVHRPWKSAIKKYIDAATERTVNEQVETFEHFEYHDSRSESFVESVFIPYLKEAGLQDVEIELPEERSVTMKFQGFQSSIISDNFLFFYPNAHYFPDVCFDRRSIQIPWDTPLSVIADFLKMMPRLNQMMDETILKALHIYDEQMMQNPAYRAAVEHLETLAKQYAGKPVGKLMKYLRWEVGRLFGRRFLIPSIKVINDTAFSFVEKKRKELKNNNWIYEDVVQQRWLDAECHKIYVDNPVSTDADARINSWTIHNFIREYMSGDSYPFLSIDFIEQKL